MENNFNFENINIYEIGICQCFDWKLNEIISPKEIFEILFYYLNAQSNSFNKDSLLEIFDNLFDELIFKNLKILLKFNIGILSISIFYYALSSVEERFQLEHFKSFILAFLTYPVISVRQINPINAILQHSSQKDLDYFSHFASKIDSCCLEIYELILRV